MCFAKNLRIITKNHEADPKIGFLSKSISKPPAWELKFFRGVNLISKILISIKGVQTIFRLLKKNAVDSAIKFPKKSICDIWSS